METTRINQTEPEFENNENEETIPFSMRQEAAIAVIEEMISTISHQLQSNPQCVITGPIKEKIIADIMDAFKQGRFVEPQINSFSGKSLGGNHLKIKKEIEIIKNVTQSLYQIEEYIQTMERNENHDLIRNKIDQLLPAQFCD